MSVNNKNLKATEGVDVIKAIHSDSSTNYGIWWVKKGRKKSILKLQASGPGGLEEVKAALDATKIQFFKYRVTGIDERAGATSIRTKFVRGCHVGESAGALSRANAGIIQSDVFTFLQDAHKSYQIASHDEMDEEIVEADLRAASGAHQVQRFDFSNSEARISKKAKAPASPAPKLPAAAAPAAAADSRDATIASQKQEIADLKAQISAAASAAPAAAAPAPSGPVKLIYFNAHGRGEAIRLILKAGGVEFEDQRVEFQEWPALKSDPDALPSKLFGVLPVLSHGDFIIGQSRAVQTYAAGIALPTTCATAQAVALDSMFQNTHGDIQSELYKCLFGTDESKAAAAAGINGAVAPHFAALEKHLPESGFIKGGDKPSAADMCMFDIGSSSFPSLMDLGIDLTAFPKFTKLVATVGAFPAIAAYVKERA